MNRKINGHTAAYFKRQAKTIAKQQNIPHHQALDIAVREAGFNNWKHFLNSSGQAGGEPQTEVSAALPATLKKNASPAAKKLNPYRNLLVAGINELLKNGHIALDSNSALPDVKSKGHFFTELFGFPSVVLWRDIGFEELIISVWWKYDHNLHPQANLTGNQRENFNLSSPLAKKAHYKKFVGVTVSCWLERREGKYMQGKDAERLIDKYTRAGEKAALDQLPQQKPLGYKTQGKFHF